MTASSACKYVHQCKWSSHGDQKRVLDLLKQELTVFFNCLEGAGTE